VTVSPGLLLRADELIACSTFAPHCDEAFKAHGKSGSVGEILGATWQVNSVAVESLKRFEHGTIVLDQQPLGNMKPIVRIDADEVGVECGVMNFGERDAIGHDGLSEPLILIGHDVSGIQEKRLGYLLYVFDLWAARWRRHEATGDMILMRYADDIVVGFEHEADARRFWDDMRKRFEEFSLSLNPDKTRLIEFGRFAAERRAHRGLGKPETFNFLGFTFICERNSRGQFLVKRTTRRDRMRATLRRVKEELRRRMHEPIPEQGAWLKQVVGGFFAYHAVPTNGPALKAFYYYVMRIWLRTLRRRGQKDRFSWQRMRRLAADWLPQPRILHPYPDKRFAVMHPRQEPCAGIPPARIWAGGGQQ
jgi:Reverse transcriptase (RNA-dependent DNA polymerase)